MKYYKRIVPLILACMMLAGCGQNVYKKGVESLENKDYKAAQENFQKAVEDKKNVADSYRGLGIAYYEQQCVRCRQKTMKMLFLIMNKHWIIQIVLTI